MTLAKVTERRFNTVAVVDVTPLSLIGSRAAGGLSFNHPAGVFGRQRTDLLELLQFFGMECDFGRREAIVELFV